MIKAVHLQNFQSHQDTLINFSEGVNALVGPSDSGKTAVLRGMNWVFRNRPLGSEFVSHWKDKDTVVTIWFKDGTVVKRGRTTKGQNYYKITTAGSQGGESTQTIKNFGQGVPDEVVEILNLSSVNIQYQMDSPFLLSVSPGEVGRYLNEVAHLDSIDTALSKVNGLLRKAGTDAQANERRVKELGESLTTMSWVDEAEGRLSVLEALEGEVKTARKNASRLLDLGSGARQARQEAAAYDPVVRHQANVLALISVSERLEKDKGGFKTLSTLAKGIREGKERTQLYEAILAWRGYVEGLIKLDTGISGEVSRSAALRGLIKDVRDTAFLAGQGAAKLSNLEEEYHELTPEICPLCGEPRSQ